MVLSAPSSFPVHRLLAWPGALWRRLRTAAFAHRDGEQQHFRTIADCTYDWETWFDVGGRPVWINPAVERFTGHTVRECLRMRRYPLPLVLPEDRTLVFGIIRRARAGLPVNDVPFRLRRRDGATLWVAVSCQAVIDAEGHPLGWRSSVRDIGERRLIEEALRESEARFRHMSDTAPVLIWMSGPDKGCTFFNKTWLDFTGRTMAQELGNGWTENVHPEDRDRAWATYATAFDDRRPFELEYRLRRRDGAWRWLMDRGVPRRGADGTFLGYIGSCTDMTEAKTAQAEMNTAKERAEHASMAKSRFLAAASHDLRQPLQAARMFTEIAAKRAGDPQMAQVVGRLQSSLDALSDLLNGLLDISRLEAGAIAPDRRTMPVAEVLAPLADEFGALAEDSGLRFRYVPSRALIDSDPVLLTRMLRNLLSNALRYTRHGDILIGCRRRGARLGVQVWDTGIGIPPGELDAIFEEFYQIGNVARDRRQGLGLGLAIVDRLGRLLGHPVTVRSRPGQGSVFEIRVPLPVSEAVAMPAAAAGAADRSARRGIVVLVEDDADVREALRLWLEGWGHRVAAGAGAEEALVALHDLAAHPDLILADYRLPEGRTGRDAIAWLREQVGAAVPGIILTGDTSPQVLAAMRDGSVPLLHKPVTAELLQDAVRQALSRTPA
jgi:PAS domain S-box-containing protein